MPRKMDETKYNNIKRLQKDGAKPGTIYATLGVSNGTQICIRKSTSFEHYKRLMFERNNPDRKKDQQSLLSQLPGSKGVSDDTAKQIIEVLKKQNDDNLGRVLDELAAIKKLLATPKTVVRPDKPIPPKPIAKKTIKRGGLSLFRRKNK